MVYSGYSAASRNFIENHGGNCEQTICVFSDGRRCAIEALENERDCGGHWDGHFNRL